METEVGIVPEGTRLIVRHYSYKIRFQEATRCMKLSYRGIQYDYSPVTVDMAPSHLSGHYRGHAVSFNYPRHIPVPQVVAELKYRGVAYSKTATGGIEVVAPSESPIPVVPSRTASAFQARRALMNEVARMHRESIERSLQHRLDVARQRGDQNLVGLLEREMQQMA